MNRSSPLIHALSLIVAAAFLGLAFVLGAVLIGVLLMLGAVAAVVIAVRIWWLQRRARAATVAHFFGGPGQAVIEGDYTVVDESDRKANRRRSISSDDAQSRPREPSG